MNNNWLEIQEGLFLEQNSFSINGITHYNSILHSKSGYHFYDVNDEIENNEKIYATYMVTPITDIEELNKQFVSVKIDLPF